MNLQQQGKGRTPSHNIAKDLPNAQENAKIVK